MKQNAAIPGLRAGLFLPLIASGLLLVGCGAGSGIDGYKPAPQQTTGALPALEISTRSVPMGHGDASYPATQLATIGATGPVSWALTDGVLPHGVTLSNEGLLSGTPSETGLFPITVRARDGAREDAQDLLLSIDAFGVAATDGLHFGEAWTGEAITLTTAGASGAVDYEIVHDETAGYLHNGSFVPGVAGGSDAVVTLRAIDRDTGAQADIELTVQPHPAGGFVPRFGATDVWFLDFDLKAGAHGYATDLHASLAALGLRDRNSYGTLGEDHDQAAELLVRREVLKHMNRMFLRNDDGTAGTEGLGISFAMERPDAAYAHPAPGSTLPGASTRYSVMSLYESSTRQGFLGAAVIDMSTNPNHVNNSAGSGAGELGVFLDAVTAMTSSGYRLTERSVAGNPVNEDDLPILKAMLYSEDVSGYGERGADIEYVVWAIARSIAAVAAHEIAHSCGLRHNTTTVPGAIMNYAATIHPQATYTFLPENVAALRVALPGPGRFGAPLQSKPGSPQTLAAQATFFGSGVCVCNQR